MFASLIILHATLAYVKFHSTYIGRFFMDKLSFFMMIEICVICWICDFKFYDAFGSELFANWLGFEACIVSSFVAGGVLYLLIYHLIRRPSLELPASTC